MATAGLIIAALALAFILGFLTAVLLGRHN